MSDADLNVVNSALRVEVRILQKLLKGADKRNKILSSALIEIARTERDSCSEWFQDVASAALTKAGKIND